MDQAQEERATQHLIDFLEAAIHQILYVRAVYPSELFERRKLFGVLVMQSSMSRAVFPCLLGGLLGNQPERNAAQDIPT